MENRSVLYYMDNLLITLAIFYPLIKLQRLFVYTFLKRGFLQKKTYCFSFKIFYKNFTGGCYSLL